MFFAKIPPLEKKIIALGQKLKLDLLGTSLKKNKAYNGSFNIIVEDFVRSTDTHHCYGVLIKFDLDNQLILLKFKSKAAIAAINLVDYYLLEYEDLALESTQKLDLQFTLNQKSITHKEFEWTAEPNWLEEKGFLDFLQKLKTTDDNLITFVWPDTQSSKDTIQALKNKIVSLETDDLGEALELETSRRLRVLLGLEPEICFDKGLPI